MSKAQRLGGGGSVGSAPLRNTIYYAVPRTLSLIGYWSVSSHPVTCDVLTVPFFCLPGPSCPCPASPTVTHPLTDPLAHSLTCTARPFPIPHSCCECCQWHPVAVTSPPLPNPLSAQPVAHFSRTFLLPDTSPPLPLHVFDALPVASRFAYIAPPAPSSPL